MKRLILFLFLASGAWGQSFYHYENILLNQAGQPIVGVNVWVCTGNVTPLFTGNPPCTLATVYSDQAGSLPITQPITTSPLGNYSFYAASPNTYTLAFSGNGITNSSDVLTIPVVSGAVSTTATNLTGPGAITGTFSGSPTLSGNPTFSGTPSFIGSGNIGTLGLGSTALSANNSFTGTATFTGPLTTKYINNIRIAANFIGGDWCAKVTAAFNDLVSAGATGGEIWIDQSAGTSLCAASPPGGFLFPLTFRFTQPGTYHLPAWLINNTGWVITSNPIFSIIGTQGVKLQFDGTMTNALTIDGSAFGNLTSVYIQNIEISGSSTVTNGLVLKGVARSRIDGLRAGNVTGNAVWCQFCGADVSFWNTQINPNQAPFSSGATPTNGIVVDWISSGANASNDTWIYDPDIEGLSGTAIKFLGSSEGHVRGGVINANAIGISIIPVDASVTGIRHTIDAVHMERQTTNDVLVQGYGNTIKDVTGAGTGYTNVLLSTGSFGAPNDNLFIGGWYNTVTINSGSIRNVFIRLNWNYSGTGSFTDSGTGTAQIDVKNWSTGARVNVSPVAYLPNVAGAVDSGSTLLPFGNLWLGTAATNNFKFAPNSTSAARVVTINDPGFPSTLQLAANIAASASGNANIGATTLVTAPATNANCPSGLTANCSVYEVDWYIDVSAVGTSCTGNTTFNFNILYTDPLGAAQQTVANALSITTNGTLGNLIANGRQMVVSKLSTTVQYSVTGFTAGSACSPAPKFQITPTVKQLQ